MHLWRNSTKKAKIDRQKGSGEGDFSLELLPDFAADHMFIGAYGDDEKKWLEEITRTSLWNNLPAAKSR